VLKPPRLPHSYIGTFSSSPSRTVFSKTKMLFSEMKRAHGNVLDVIQSCLWTLKIRPSIESSVYIKLLLNLEEIAFSRALFKYMKSTIFRISGKVQWYIKSDQEYWLNSKEIR
jgi:hypothetical protein